MKDDKQKNLVMIVIATLVLAALNAGVWLASQKGVITPVGNIALWGAFVVLNVVSIIWAISLLGLQPLVVAISYVVGGGIAFWGVREASDINVAEVVTAGATYGAFGALAICHATTKVRLAFFNKGQVPFIFIIVALLVLDAIINSGVSSAGIPVILNAVVLPFALAGVLIGVLWTVVNRVVLGKKSAPEKAVAQTLSTPSVAKEVKKAPEAAPIKMQAPAPAVAKPEPKVVAPVAKEVKPPEPPPAPVVETEADKPAAVKVEKEEQFFPLEIDRDQESVPQKKEPIADRRDAVEKKAEPFARPAFYTKPNVSEVKPEIKVEAKPEAKVEAKPEAKVEAKPEAKPEVKPEAKPEFRPVASRPEAVVRPAPPVVAQESAKQPEAQKPPPSVPEKEVARESVKQPESQPPSPAEPEKRVVQESIKQPEAEKQTPPAAEKKEEEKKSDKEGGGPKPPPGKSEDWLNSHMDLLKKLK